MSLRELTLDETKLVAGGDGGEGNGGGSSGSSNAGDGSVQGSDATGSIADINATQPSNDDQLIPTDPSTLTVGYAIEGQKPVPWQPTSY